MIRRATMTFNPAKPDHPHEDWQAVTAAMDQLCATLARMREYDGLGPAEPEASREHDELRERIVDLIEVGASYDLLQAILDRRALARRKQPRR